MKNKGIILFAIIQLFSMNKYFNASDSSTSDQNKNEALRVLHEFAYNYYNNTERRNLSRIDRSSDQSKKMRFLDYIECIKKLQETERNKFLHEFYGECICNAENVKKWLFHNIQEKPAMRHPSLHEYVESLKKSHTNK